MQSNFKLLFVFREGATAAGIENAAFASSSSNVEITKAEDVDDALIDLDDNNKDIVETLKLSEELSERSGNFQENEARDSTDVLSSIKSL